MVSFRLQTLNPLPRHPFNSRYSDLHSLSEQFGEEIIVNTNIKKEEGRDEVRDLKH
jgi:hypothetical protein